MLWRKALRLDRHERLAKAFKKLRCYQDNFWKKELNTNSRYSFGISPIISENLSTPPLLCYDIHEAAEYRSVAIHVHYLALCGLIERPYIELEKGFNFENLFGCPEITLLKSQRKPSSYLLNHELFVPFWVSVNDVTMKMKKLIDMSLIFSFNEQDFAISQCFNLKEEISEFETKGAWERAVNWSRITQNKASRLFKNRDLPVGNLWEQFINENGFTAYPFKTDEKKTIGESLIQVNCFINESSHPYYDKEAKRWLSCLVKALFKDSKLTFKQEADVLSYFEISHPIYFKKTSKNLILELSAYPIDYQRMVKYLNALYSEFLANPQKNKLSGTLLLIILISLQASHRKERVFSAEDVLNLRVNNWQSNDCSFMIGNHILKVSHGLSVLIEAFIPNAKIQNRKLFDISRSWINKHLREINSKLSYDWDNDPVTLQTFIARPTHDWIGNRFRPILWNVASKVNRYHLRAKRKALHSNPDVFLKKHSFTSKKDTSNMQIAIILEPSNFPLQKNAFKAFKMSQLS
jgi:hypothetical protein